MISPQLPLKLRWPAEHCFSNYISGDNAAAVALLIQAATATAVASSVFLAGPSGCGKTHLLMACCNAAAAAKLSAQYLALSSLKNSMAESIRAFGGSALLCIDDVDAIAGQAEAEHALFDLYNRCTAENSTLIFSAKSTPAQAGLKLPDLISRLSSSAQVLIKPLTDAQRREALRQRAERRGLKLDDAVLEYLFTYHARDLTKLTALLERLDRESLAAQRKITVPFLKQFISER